MIAIDLGSCSRSGSAANEIAEVGAHLNGLIRSLSAELRPAQAHAASSALPQSPAYSAPTNR